MTKQEFEERLGKAVNDRDYAKIEEVYTTHPSISETEGKDQIAYLYKTFGMRTIEDILPTARKAREIEASRGIGPPRLKMTGHTEETQ